MCTACHNAKTRNVEQLGARHVIKGCDERGLPVDPAHPFWGYTPSKDGMLQRKDRRPDVLIHAVTCHLLPLFWDLLPHSPKNPIKSTCHLSPVTLTVTPNGNRALSWAKLRAR
jgi:hypothetical protein